MLQGLELSALERAWRGTHFTPGARTLVATMRSFGATTALVSGGFTYFTERVAAELGFDLQRANILLDNGSTLTGEVAEPILDRDTKLATLQALAAQRGVKLAATLAVGDGANDLAMLQQAGLGIAYYAKPIVAAGSPQQYRTYGFTQPAFRARLSGQRIQGRGLSHEDQSRGCPPGRQNFVARNR